MNESLRNIWTILKRELTGYFASPVAYVFIVIFLLLKFIFKSAGEIFMKSETRFLGRLINPI